MTSRFVAATAALALFAGCSQSYVNTPKVAAARAESARSFSDPLIARAFQARPAIRFPARLAMAPINDLAGQELRALDAAGTLDHLKTLPDVAAVTSVSSLVVSQGDGKPRWNQSDLVLREAAAKLHADAIFLFKIETHVSDGKLFAPLTTVSLGLFPNNRAEVIATALAVLVDTRTGYVYGTLERSAGRISFSMSWDDFTRDRTIERASRQASTKLFAEIPDFWRGVVQAHRR